jgi:RecB family endonuclease NucS
MSEGGQYGLRLMRLLVARCEVLYTGRLTARLPQAVRLLMFKADGSFLVHDDAGGFRPLNWIRSAFRPEFPAQSVLNSVRREFRPEV